MKAKEKKMGVLHQLSQEAEPINLSELLKKLGSEYSERSVRRWLSEMITEGLVEKSGQSKSTKYQVLKRDSRDINKVASFFGLESTGVIEHLFSYMRTCAMNDSTVKTIGFDEIRVRYRQQRRDILRHIILNKLKGLPMQEYISNQSMKFIKKEDQTSFIEDVMEDLKEIDLSRITGLGITPDQMHAWIIA